MFAVHLPPFWCYRKMMKHKTICVVQTSNGLGFLRETKLNFSYSLNCKLNFVFHFVNLVAVKNKYLKTEFCWSWFLGLTLELRGLMQNIYWHPHSWPHTHWEKWQLQGGAPGSSITANCFEGTAVSRPDPFSSNVLFTMISWHLNMTDPMPEDWLQSKVLAVGALLTAPMWVPSKHGEQFG